MIKVEERYTYRKSWCQMFIGREKQKETYISSFFLVLEREYTRYENMYIHKECGWIMMYMYIDMYLHEDFELR